MIHKAFEVFITSNGSRVPEFDIKVENNQVDCFIPSEANKTFSICFKSYFQEASGSVRWGIRVAPTLRKPFQFSELALTEEDNFSISENVLQNLGCIEVNVHRVQRIGKEMPVFKSTDVAAIGAVNEKSKKAGSHCVSLGAARSCISHRRTDSIPFLPGEGCFVKFRFRYRPPAILQAQGVISREQSRRLTSQSGSSSQSQGSHTDGDHSRADSRKRRRAAVEAPADVDVKLKASESTVDQESSSQSSQNDGQNDKPAKRVKRESASTPATLSGSVIDLTDDIKREASPIHIPAVHVGTVIDLTLEDD
ncbi:hypothetical protein EIP91_005355 [Steccherinum ochraceum]|uniref:DUF7918 domain-containing protein n=1 Tax=Steccherinum ochraceum TaxID=92696 RepID=A0A4R0R9V5_9APHY|nr:hypothetical protein EIP91_005355 [Steccherinum ochraceum]